MASDDQCRTALSRVHFVTYGSGAYAPSLKLLVGEAVRFGFSNIHAYGPETVSRDFIRAHRDFFVRSPRGDGYWLWKPYIVQDVLSRVPNGAIVLYADAGCAVNPGARHRFQEWMDFCDAHETISFQMRLPEHHWTKMSVARFMNCDAPEYLQTGQIMSGIFGLKKTSNTVELVRRWYDLCALEWTIDDSVQSVANADSFREHRHDQSVFSLLRKQAGCVCLPERTYPEGGDWSSPSIARVPIVGRRRRLETRGEAGWLAPGSSLAHRAAAEPTGESPG